MHLILRRFFKTILTIGTLSLATACGDADVASPPVEAVKADANFVEPFLAENGEFETGKRVFSSLRVRASSNQHIQLGQCFSFTKKGYGLYVAYFDCSGAPPMKLKKPGFKAKSTCSPRFPCNKFIGPRKVNGDDHASDTDHDWVIDVNAWDGDVPTDVTIQSTTNHKDGSGLAGGSHGGGAHVTY